jgi:hypothetical protein
MSLSNFTTLELAHSYAETRGRMTSPDMVVSFLTEHDSTLTLLDLAKTDIKTSGFLLALNGAVTQYNLITGNIIGDKHQLLLSYLVSIGAVTQEFKESIILHANPVIYPYAIATQEDFDEAHDAGELITLNQNNTQHVINLTINKQPRKPTNLVIQHRFGLSVADLTEWHDCGTVQNTYYTQRSYQTMIPASPSVYREMRLVSPLTLGVSIV